MNKRHVIAAISGAAAAGVVLKLLARPRDVDWCANRDVIFHAEHSRFTTVDGIPVHYQDVGSKDAPPLIAIHGFCSSTLVWSKVLLQLAAAGSRVIVPDLVGYGYSGKPRNFDYTITSQARVITGLIERLGLNGTTLAGSSYGGAVAATVALDYPQRVSRLVLVGAVTNNDPRGYLLMRLFGSPVLGDVISPLLIGSRRLLRRRMKRVYDRHSWVLDDRRVLARHVPLRSSATHRAIVRTVRRWDADRIERQAHLITQPTLLLWGENDPEIPLRYGQILHSKIKGSRLVIFRNCGHLPHEEFPDDFTQIVSNFCRPQDAFSADVESEIESVEAVVP